MCKAANGAQAIRLHLRRTFQAALAKLPQANTAAGQQQQQSQRSVSQHSLPAASSGSAAVLPRSSANGLAGSSSSPPGTLLSANSAVAGGGIKAAAPVKVPKDVDRPSKARCCASANSCLENQRLRTKLDPVRMV